MGRYPVLVSFFCYVTDDFVEVMQNAVMVKLNFKKLKFGDEILPDL